MSLTTHDPREPCIGHCPACGAYSDWSERITGLLAALERLLDCPALNLDSLEQEDVAAIQEGQTVAEAKP